jgi:ribonuclease HI
VNWDASEFWVDGGCLGNQAYGKRKAYGSISDGAAIMRVQFANARTSNEAEYMALSLLLGNLLSHRVDPQKPQTNIYTDSLLVVGQLTQGSKVKAKNLLALHDEAALRLQKTGANLVWVPRNQIVKQLGH